MLVGTIGSPRRALVEGSGRVTVAAGTPDEVLIGWWIGGEDRWYIPEREITVRQSLVQGAPVVMTAIRIPGGDATHTVYGAVQGPRELAVIEIANKARAPIVGVLTVSGPGARNVTVDGSTVRVDGFALISLPRPPLRTASAESLRDLEAVVTGGAAGEGPSGLSGSDAGAFALMVPVSQATSIRASVLIGASSSIALSGTPVLGSLPDVHTAASGWGVHLARGPRLTSPDQERNERLRALIGGALLAAEPAIADRTTTVRTRAILARALDAVGLHAEAGALLENIDDHQNRRGVIDDATPGQSAVDGLEGLLTTAAVVEALAHHAWVTADPVFAETFAPAATGAVEAIVKATRKNDALRPLLACAGSLRALFVTANDPRAAIQAKMMWERFGSPWPLPSVALPPLPASSAGGSFVPEGSLRLAAAIRASTDDLARVGPDGAVDLFGAFVPSWRGSSFDVRNVAVPGGRLSAAVRWHGHRAALLWEVDGPNEVTITCRSVDSAWSASGRRGDALLGPSV